MRAVLSHEIFGNLSQQRQRTNTGNSWDVGLSLLKLGEDGHPIFRVSMPKTAYDTKHEKKISVE